nr:hypothetical protein [Tanacetum cinerariifolium]
MGVVARDEKWVPSIERVKISSANVRLETTVQQKEETFKVVIDVIMNSTCFKAFTITAKVLEIFMQQFWYTIKKVKDSKSYEFLLANKKCIVDVEVFRKILDICKRVKGEEFIEVQDDDATLTFLIDLGYKGPLHKYTNIVPRETLIDNCYQSSLWLIHKTTDTLVVDVEVSKESDSEPAKKRTASRRVVKKKVTIVAANNIIPNPDVALELGKSISLTEAAEEEAPSTRGSSKGTSRIPGVLDESIVVSATSKEDQGDDEEVDWIDSDEDEEKKDDTDDDKSIDLEITNDEETNDEFVQGVEQVNDDEDEEMTNVKVKGSGNGDEENTNVDKADVEKTEEVKNDAKKAKLPPISSSLFVSSRFGDQFLKLSFDTSLVSTVKDTTDVNINSLSDTKIQSEVPHIQYPSVLKVSVFMISKPSLLTLVQETPSVAPVTTLPPLSVSTIPHRHTADLIQKYSMKPASESSKIQKPAIKLEQESEKSASMILKIKSGQAEKQKMPKYKIKSTDKKRMPCKLSALEEAFHIPFLQAP